MKTLTVRIDGMHCDGCARIIETVLSRLDGVETVSVSYAEATARVLYDPAQLSESRVHAAVENAGYRIIPPGELTADGR